MDLQNLRTEKMKISRSLMLGVAFAFVLGTGVAVAQSDVYAPSNLGGYGFEGFYAGVLLGGVFDSTSAYLSGPDVNAFSAGLAVGVNFYLTESVIGGLEVQGGANFATTATTFDALGLARLGFAPGDEFMVYGAAGLGAIAGNGVYAFGAGVEGAVMQSVSVRGEVLGLGTWGAAPNAMKATAGLIWRMQ